MAEQPPTPRIWGSGAQEDQAQVAVETSEGRPRCRPLPQIGHFLPWASPLVGRDPPPLPTPLTLSPPLVRPPAAAASGQVFLPTLGLATTITNE